MHQRQQDYTLNDEETTVGPAPAGENPKRRQEEFDGLGRLRSVCEINALGGDGACGQTVAQSGYLTAYVRNPLGQITQVTQNAQTTPGAGGAEAVPGRLCRDSADRRLCRL